MLATTKPPTGPEHDLLPGPVGNPNAVGGWSVATHRHHPGGPPPNNRSSQVPVGRCLAARALLGLRFWGWR